MYIKQLEIDNFKSFANKVDIPLLEGFTTISGPNGSGKSNIIDSILFALGLSTSRTLRAEKLFHLICNLTKKNEAFVKVTFGGVENLSEDLTVARRLRKSTNGYNSVYYLNDRIVTLSEIHSILEQYNITPNSYNVVMQNDVMSITNCSPNERRKIIDEVAGVADFDRRIDQANGELETVEQRVERSTFILNEVDDNLKKLEEEKEVALKYQKLKDEKTVLDNQISSVKFFDIKRNLEKAHENILEFTKKKKEEADKYKDLSERVEIVRSKYTEISELVKEKGEAQQIEIKKKAEELKGSIDRKKSAIDYTEKQIQDGLKKIENAKNSIEIQNKRIADTKLKIQMKQDEIKAIEDNIFEKKTLLKEKLEEMTGLNQTADQHLEKRNALRKNLESLKDEENNLLKEKYPLETELNNLNKGLAEAKTKLTELQTFKENFAENKDRLEVQVEELKKELLDFKSIQQSTMQDLDTAKAEVNDLTYDLNMAYKKCATLEAQKQAADEVNFNRAVEMIMTSRLQGVHAPLVKLGKVDKEYSTAMEVAIGGRMEHIVVDDDHVAQVAIEVLKSSNSGRATFIPLNKIRKAPTNLNLPREKGVIDFAINLIAFDDMYLDAFFYAVGETLVVEDFDTARRLMGKYRIVTLKGEIFEKSGSISGGSLRRTGLKFNNTDDSEIEKFKLKVATLEKKLHDAETKKRTLEEKLDKVRADYSSATTECNKAQIELNNFVKAFENNDLQINERTEYIKNTQPQIEKISKQLDTMEEKNVYLATSILDVQSQIEEVEKLMNNDVLKELKEKTESIENDIKRLNDNLMRANNEVSEFNRQISFDSSICDTRYEEIDAIKKANENLEKNIVSYKSEIEELKVKLEVLETQIEEISEKLKELFAQRDAINTELMEMEKQKHIKESDLERIAEQIESFKARRRELEPELETAREELEATGVKISQLEPVTISIDEINSKIQRLQRKMDELGDVNMRAIKAYDEVLERQTELKNQIETLTNERLQIIERMKGYEQLKKEAFMKTYNNLNVTFKEVFHELSDGEGTLVLEVPDEPLQGGLTIDAQPRDKKMQRLESMSGGEKSLTALAFVFAIQRYLPAPFYAFDEVDANLDGINVEKLANLVQNQAKNTQFIVVSHRKPMIESANRTIGVTQKEKGITKVTGVKLRD